jgi:vitamin B12 transporter
VLNRFFFTIVFICIFINLSAQDKVYNFDEITITAGRSPVAFSDLARAVVVLNSLEIKTLPANNIQDLLKYINAVDLKTRGAEGVQSDVGIRGGTFEQTLIMIDGVKISDPQTGHHNLNLPVSVDNVERIEVLKGQGSQIFGPNAFGGAINIITKKEKEPSFSFSVLGGEHNLFNLSLNASYPVSIIGNNISFSKRKSDGYRHNTNFDIIDFSFNQNYLFGNNQLNLFLGYVDKKFGANNFYSDLYPNQWEHTTTKLLSISSNFGKNALVISPKIFWRGNDDDYILDNSRPDFYRNNHNTNSFGIEVQTSLKTSSGVTSFGGEFNKEEIASSNLGNHSRLKGGFFFEQVLDISKSLSASAGFFVYNYSNTELKIWPGINAAYKISDRMKTFVSVGKAFRIPTFTELYYKSPANLGNPDLMFEESMNYELGFSYSGKTNRFESSIFLKDGKNIIDWARVSQTAPWKVENVPGIKTTGFEISYTFFPCLAGLDFAIGKINLSYTYLSANRSSGAFQSKYVLENLRHQLLANIDNDLPFGLQQNWSFIFRDRANFSQQVTTDTQIYFSLEELNIFIRATNIFNTSYEDFSGVALPGRWISCGIKYRIR